MGVIAYALGVATVSFYLRHNDIPDPDLSFFKAHFIYTGIVLLCFLALPSALAYACSTAMGGWGDLPPWAVALIVAAMLIAGGFLIWLIYHWILQTKAGIVDKNEVVVALELLGTSLHAAALGVAAYLVSGDDTLNRAGACLLIVFTVAATLWYVSLFSRHIYPILPDQFGGGKPKQARILFSPSGVIEARQLGIPFKGKEQISSPVTILLAGDTFYAVRNPEGKVVQIAKDGIRGLQEDSKSPHAVDVQTKNRGRVMGLPEPRDRLILTFSEEMEPASLIPDWDGSATEARIFVVRTEDDADELRFRSSDDKTALPHLGEIELHRGRYHRMFGKRSYAVTIVEKGSQIIVTLKAGVGERRQSVTQSETMVWRPSPKAVDDVGNYSYETPAPENNNSSPHADIDF